VFSDARRAAIVGGLVVFGLGVLVGFWIGRSGREEVRSSAPGEAATTGPVASPTAAAPPEVVTPEPGQEPAIGTQGQVLLEADRAVVPVPAASPCQALVAAGSLGECGEVPVAGGRVIWLVERSATAAGATSIRARVLTFVPDAGGWVEWLQAADPTGDRWTDVNVVPSDLTGDGLPELLVGFRGGDELQTLEYDVVGYDQGGLPRVLAHPEAAARGVVVLSSGGLQEFAAEYPSGEPACCPPSYLRRTIAYDDGFFRVIASETVPPNAVPASQL
jgi:hypothetical protein